MNIQSRISTNYANNTCHVLCFVFLHWHNKFIYILKSHIPSCGHILRVVVMDIAEATVERLIGPGSYVYTNQPTNYSSIVQGIDGFKCPHGILPFSSRKDSQEKRESEALNIDSYCIAIETEAFSENQKYMYIKSVWWQISD